MMNLFAKKDTSSTSDQALVITFVDHGEFGTKDERQSIEDLADRLKQTVEGSNLGEYDGEDYGNQECRLYLYGPDSDAMPEKARPVLEASIFRPFRVHQIYGDVTDPSAPEKKSRIV